MDYLMPCLELGLELPQETGFCIRLHKEALILHQEDDVHQKPEEMIVEVPQHHPHSLLQMALLQRKTLHKHQRGSQFNRTCSFLIQQQIKNFQQ
jgi:hypothetical protein